MASPFQQRVRLRKIVYVALILALFTFSWAWRRYAVEAKADSLALREQNKGEVELSGAVIRLSLTGLRGWATCWLWNTAMDKQKKNQWNELELVVNSLTKIQPHFISTWLFQSWNIAYNVSVESDRVSDKFYFITRGVVLLADGERQNLNDPDLRWSIGFYVQNKICQSDETNVQRSLFQLSCIPPNERDPARFRTETPGGTEINYLELEKFCTDHPQLVRRLRQGILRETKREQRRQFTCEKAEDMVQFLSDNFRLPSLYEEVPPSAPGGWRADRTDHLRNVSARFPPLPPKRKVPYPQHVFDPNELTDEDASKVVDSVDGHAVARAWYGYAQEPIPDPGELPGETSPVVNRSVQRKPRHMATVIFRDYPARAQSYVGERLEQEGWFDEEGWEIPGWFQAQNDKFADGSPARVGQRDGQWAAKAWSDAHRLWERHGEENHLLLNPNTEANYRKLADEFKEQFKLEQDLPPPELRRDVYDPKTLERADAYRFMHAYKFFRTLCNFPHHYARCLVESKKETVTARKLFYKADMLRLTGSPDRALEVYNDPNALAGYRDKVLLNKDNKDFRYDSFMQEDNYEVSVKYTDLFNEQQGRRFKERLAKMAPLVPLFPFTNAAQVPQPIIRGPFDYEDEDGVPLIADWTRSVVMQRKNRGPMPGPVPQDLKPVKRPTPKLEPTSN